VERRNGICCWDFGGSAEGNANEHEEEEDTWIAPDNAFGAIFGEKIFC
jgi:hypothetical protein